MKTLIAVLALISLSGCASYSTHLRTGCIFECAKWEQWERDGQLATASGPVANTYTPNTGISGRTYITPVGGYQAIRSGSTTTVTRVSK
jgi:hypothetical protein